MQLFANFPEPVEAQADSIATLRIYLGGDGIPWLDARRISRDPTPRAHLALRLLSADADPALFIARPCYYLQPPDSRCHAEHWTSGRYSDDVVRALARVISTYTDALRPRQVWLVGYSGGGALARLVAPHLDGGPKIVTIAANLDHAEWTRLKRFRPLTHSLNPATEPPITRPADHVHLSGGRDEIVPAAVFAAYIERGHLATHWVYPEFTHDCCWVDAWPEILERLTRYYRASEQR